MSEAEYCQEFHMEYASFQGRPCGRTAFLDDAVSHVRRGSPMHFAQG